MWTTCSRTFGPARLPSFVTWPTTNSGDVLTLGSEQDLCRGLPHLPDAAWRDSDLQREDGLNRVDDEERWLEADQLLENPFETGLCEEIKG